MVNSYRYVFAASTPTIPVSGTTVDLGIGEIGVFDGKTFQATSGVTAKSILIVTQGLYHPTTATSRKNRFP
jgi:diphthamide synthase subunit DPH2